MDKKSLRIMGLVGSALSTFFAMAATACWCALVIMKIRELKENEEYNFAFKSVLSRCTQGFNKRLWKKEIVE